MSLLRWLVCLFGHASDPLIVLRGKVMHHECRNCQADLGVVLPDQVLKVKTVKVKRVTKRKPKPLAKVIGGGRFQ